MIQISLLPREKKQLLREKRIRGSLIGVSIASLFILLIFAAGIFVLIGAYTFTNATLKNQIQDKEKEVESFEKLEKEVEKYDANTALYDKLISERISWSEILAEIEKVVPTGVQLTNTSIDQDEKEDAITISAQGYAIDRREVAKLVKKLEDSEKFTDVVLSSSNITQDNKADFQISFKFKQ